MTKAVIFDVDGTLLDTTEGILSSVRYTIEKHQLPELDRENLLHFIGPPIQDSFAKHYGLAGDILQELATTFRDHYKDADLYKAIPYDGIYEVCEQLKTAGIPMAVATYKRQDYAEKIVRYFGFGKYTDIIFGADHENRLKKVDIIRRCLNAMGVPADKDAVMIGDSDNDATGAGKIGIGFLGVTYGFGFHSDGEIMSIPHAIGTAHTPGEIISILLSGKEYQR